MRTLNRVCVGFTFLIGGWMGTFPLWSVAAFPSAPAGSEVVPKTSAPDGDLRTSPQEEAETDGKRLSAEVFHCHDGDTCRVKVADGLWLNVRLAGIDAPEVAKARGAKKGQVFGNEAREYLNKIVKGRKIELRQVDLDPYNRPVVELFDKESNINLQLIEEGYAEVYRGKTKRFDKSLYLKAEEKAQKAKKGIWSLSSYQSPKDFRQEQKQ
jgi:micrococcal nuclease